MVEDVVINVGKRVRNARRRANMSIKTLASLSGLSVAAIQRIETTRMVPTIASLSKIAEALGKDVTFLVQEEDSPKRALLTKESMRKRFYSSGSRSLHEYIAGELKNPELEAGIFTTRPGGQAGTNFNSHPGEELILCLKGEIAIELGEEKFRLEAGDSLNFKADIPHRWTNPGPRETQIVWISTTTGS